MTSSPETTTVEQETSVEATTPHIDRMNTLAIVAFALSLSGFTIVAQIAGIITGHIALKQIRQSGERGHELAKWGLIISYVVVGVFLLFGVFFLTLWAIALASLFSLGGAITPDMWNQGDWMMDYDYSS